MTPSRLHPHRSAADYAQFTEALVALSLAALAVKLPFRRVVRLMEFNPEASSIDQATATAVARAVDRASRRLPWRTVCFDQGLATQWMLRRRGQASILHYGVGKGPSDLTAHVWVSLDGRILVGETEAANHACVATFPSSKAPS